MKKVIVIAGPTAVGKTEISIKLAEYFEGEIINADASSFKKKLNIGTAKVNSSEMKSVKHHMIDIIDSLDNYSIKDFQVDGRKIIESVEVPFIVGGSGLYINALVQDYNLEANTRDESKFDSYDNETLYSMLMNLNSAVANKTHPNNRRRVIRYLELVLNQGEVVTREPIYIYDVLMITLTRDRKILYERINNRVDNMIASGLIDECIKLKNDGVDLSKIKDIGYSEIGLFLDGELSIDQVSDIIKQKTRNLAKRQITWFKNKTNSVFVDLDNYNINDLISKIDLFLKND
ncbi:MAG: tRNA (adenosine(37)-N6)-dimethylallyltransferase MiaA [Bacilli bacterium]